MSLARLKEALDRAVARRLVDVNVAREVKVPRNHRKAERRAKTVIPPWNLQEVRAFVDAVKNDRLYAAFLLSLMGLRPAEICGMRWADVDLGGATSTVNRTRTLMGNKGVVGHEVPCRERQLTLPDLVARHSLTSGPRRSPRSPMRGRGTRTTVTGSAGHSTGASCVSGHTRT